MSDRVFYFNTVDPEGEKTRIVSITYWDVNLGGNTSVRVQMVRPDRFDWLSLQTMADDHSVKEIGSAFSKAWKSFTEKSAFAKKIDNLVDALRKK